jgi:hypothetical protein
MVIVLLLSADVSGMVSRGHVDEFVWALGVHTQDLDARQLFRYALNET